jgi:hypothetical protein
MHKTKCPTNGPNKLASRANLPIQASQCYCFFFFFSFFFLLRGKRPDPLGVLFRVLCGVREGFPSCSWGSVRKRKKETQFLHLACWARELSTSTLESLQLHRPFLIFKTVGLQPKLRERHSLVLQPWPHWSWSEPVPWTNASLGTTT